MMNRDMEFGEHDRWMEGDPVGPWRSNLIILSDDKKKSLKKLEL